MSDRTEYYREYYKKNRERLQEYKRNYSKNVMYKNYKKYSAFIDKEKAKLFEAKLLKENVNPTDFIVKAIEEYIRKD